jgi:PAS domain S-box-containing protein
MFLRWLEMRARVRSFVSRAPANNARTRIALSVFLTSGVVLGGLTSWVAIYWSAMASNPAKSILCLFLFGAAMELCVSSLQTLLNETEHQPLFVSGNPSECEVAYLRSLDATFILDEGCRCLRANPAAIALFGIPESQFVGRPIDQFFRQTLNEQTEILENGDRLGKAIIRRPDGTSRVVEHLATRADKSRRRIIILRDITERESVEGELQENQERFLQMASNIEEVFWMMDVPTKKIIYVSPAYEVVTGRTCGSLYESPTSYQELYHPDDRVRVLARLDEATRTGTFDEEFRIIRVDGAIRWVWVRGFPIRSAQGQIERLVGTAQDTTSRKAAENLLATQLRITELARAEAEALRKVTVTLTQTLNMEAVLDSLLECLAGVVPHQMSDVLLVENEGRLFIVGSSRSDSLLGRDQNPRLVIATDAGTNPTLLSILKARETIHVANTLEAPELMHILGRENIMSWLGIPLVVERRVIGLLCLGNSQSNAFTDEHIRMAESIAVPAAIAIQNARLFERGEIYAAELEQRVKDLRETKEALRLSEEKFSKAFGSSEVG